MKSRRALKLTCLVLLAAAPAIAWTAFKPVRILAPTLNGVTCAERVCVEERNELACARTLQHDAAAAVARKLAPLEQAPLTVFCSTRECYRSFGGGMERGATLLDWGVILPPESWIALAIVEHEYIHMLQAQQPLACSGGSRRRTGSRKACRSSSASRTTTCPITRVRSLSRSIGPGNSVWT